MKDVNVKRKWNTKWDLNRKPNTTCDHCQAPIYRRPSVLKINKGKFCSRSCRNKVYRFQSIPPVMWGSKNPAWKGGVTIFHTHGNYKNIKYHKAKGWMIQMARKDGYIMEHRMIMVMMCNRLLSQMEVVHHLDHNPLNNNPNNLEMWPTNKDHKLAEVGKYVEGVANRIYNLD